MLYVFIGTVIIMIVLLTLAAFRFSTLAIKPKTFDYEENYNFFVKNGKLIEAVFISLSREEIYFDSPYGYKLHGLFFPVKDSKKTMVFAHGITHSLYGSVKYMEMFLKRGFNVFIYDHRFHGKSGGHNCTFGYYEKYDLKTACDWVFSKIGTDGIIGIHGESLGAATALQNSAIDERISFYIADCPFSDLYKLLAYRLKVEYNLPPFPIMALSSLITKLRCGAFFTDMSPISDISGVKTPIFFIHGKNDSYIPTEMSMEMFNKKPGAKKLYLAPNAGHAEAFWNNKEEYDLQIGEFLREIGVE